jgi:hypothetical protein
MPLPELCRRLRPLPARIADAAGRLRCSSVFAINLGLRGGPSVRRTANPAQPQASSPRTMCPPQVHWVYVPERRHVFYRIGCYSNAARAMAPKGHSSIWVEISHNAHRPINRKAVRRKALDALKEMGILRSRRDVVAEWQFDIPCAYVTYDAHRRKAVEAIHRHLEKHNIHSIGRYGRWEYSSMEDAFIQGRTVAHRLLDS